MELLGGVFEAFGKMPNLSAPFEVVVLQERNVEFAVFLLLFTIPAWWVRCGGEFIYPDNIGRDKIHVDEVEQECCYRDCQSCLWIAHAVLKNEKKKLSVCLRLHAR